MNIILLSSFLYIIAPILGTIILSLIGILIYRIIIKYKLNIDIKMQNIVIEVAKEAVAFVEDYSAQKLMLSGIKISSNDKLNMAIEYIVDKIPSVTTEEAKKIVPIALYIMGLKKAS